MAFTPNIYSTLLLVATVCIMLPKVHAFGAGDIPDFAYLNDKAFRHGDIESVLENLAKTAGGSAGIGSGIFGLAATVYQAATGPAKFNKSDVKRVYFGNWLRDYSQALDIAGLTKLSADTLILVLSVLGFMTFGYSTDEFQVTAERVGVYLPVEHIDNPKGYAEKEGDARKYHPKLRPPIDPRELEIDPNTGMKNYMATENRGWDTSTGFIRRTLKACIEHGRRARGQENADLWEAYRLLGTGLHTLEDLLAHSNWCELALRKMGHSQVFCHVGDRVIVNTPNGPAPPLVTGTFGGADFVHSLLGEAGDKLSQASVTDLSGRLDQAQHGNQPDFGALKSILSKLTGGNDSDSQKLDQGEQMQAASQGYQFNPDNVAPPEVQQRLLNLLRWHDDMMRDVTKKISMVPGLNSLLEEFSNALNAYIYTILAPYLTPILKQATDALNEGSKVVIDNDDQYEVFNNPNASDPSHSMLSKDHFGLILNEPAGQIAQLIVEHTVNLIVPAWSDDSNPDQVLDKILEAFHHPYYGTSRSEIQRKMFEHMQKWLGGLGPDDTKKTLQALTKESVRDHKNKRLGSENQSYDEPGYAPCSHSKYSPKPIGGSKSSNKPNIIAGAVGGAVGGYAGSQQSRPSQPSGGRYDSNTGYDDKQSSGYNQGRPESTGYQQGGYGQQESQSYGRQESATYGRQEAASYGKPQGGTGAEYGRHEQTGYGRQDQGQSYGRQYAQGTGYGRQESTGYGQGGRESQGGFAQGGKTGRRDDSPSGQTGYGKRRDDDDDDKRRYGRDDKPNQSYGGGRRDDEDSRYGLSKDRNDKPGQGYGGGRRDDDDRKYGSSYGGDEKPIGYGGGGRDDRDEPNKYGSSYGQDDNTNQSYRSGGGRRDDRNEGSAQGYGSGGQRNEQAGRRDDCDARKNKYGKDDSDDEKKKYGKKNKGDDSDDDSRRKKGGSGGISYGSGGGGGGYRPSYQQPPAQSGYAPTYGNETFGAERMRISKNSDDSDDDRHKKGKGGYGRGGRY